MNDKTIRSALVAKLRDEDPETIIFHELPLLRGKRRADIASLNGVFAGYEIKSPSDSLTRIIGQAAAYGEVFEQMTAVVAARHLRSLRHRVPDKWGIVVAADENGQVVLRQIRKAKSHKAHKNATLVRLLRKEECYRILRKCDIPIARTDLVIRMWAALERMPTTYLREEVKLALKSRFVTRPLSR